MEWQRLFRWSLCMLLLLSRFSHVQLCATPQTAAHQAPPSLGFSRQEHWSGLPFPSPLHESEKWKWSRLVVPDPQRPHGLQPSRLLRPWDFPGKSTGVECHCLLQIYAISQIFGIFAYMHVFLCTCVYFQIHSCFLHQIGPEYAYLTTCVLNGLWWCLQVLDVKLSAQH